MKENNVGLFIFIIITGIFLLLIIAAASVNRKKLENEEDIHSKTDYDRSTTTKNRKTAHVNVSSKSTLLQKFLVNSNNKIIVINLQTNGLTEGKSVLSCSAMKYTISNNILQPIDTFKRFYFPKERFNPSATSNNGLTRPNITKLRENASYAENFIDDIEFVSFCQDTDAYVAYNVEFHLKFLQHIKPKYKFCIMKRNIVTVGIERSYGGHKYPTLEESAESYGIDLNQNKVDITAQIFQKMIL